MVSAFHVGHIRELKKADVHVVQTSATRENTLDSMVAASDVQHTPRHRDSIQGEKAHVVLTLA